MNLMSPLGFHRGFTAAGSRDSVWFSSALILFPCRKESANFGGEMRVAELRFGDFVNYSFGGASAGRFPAGRRVRF